MTGLEGPITEQAKAGVTFHPFIRSGLRKGFRCEASIINLQKLFGR